MNFSSLLAIGATGLSLLLSLWLFISGMLSGSQQGRWQDQQQAQIQQQQIQAGRQLQEQGRLVLNEIGAASLPPKSNEKLKSLLAKHGITAQAAPTPAATPAAARPATPVNP
jgi:transcription initiation factor TFIID subunit TAF12